MTDLLCLGAHPDDVELSCGGLAARFAAAGRRVVIVDLTRGELGTRNDVTQRAREAEAARVALGAAERVNLGLPDGGLDRHDAAHRRAVVECLRRFRPALVVAPDRHDAHPDHVEASHLVTAAAYLSGLANLEAGGERFRPQRVLYALYRTAVEPHLVVDVGSVWERRMAAVRAHASQLDPAAGASTYLTAPGFLEAVESRARAWGALIGATHGEAFRVRGPFAVHDLAAFAPASGGPDA